jgi:GT2 family glycosyltransferase
MDSVMDISVIIVSYKTIELLQQCLRSIQIKTVNVAYEIIVVDNASDDGSIEMVETEYPDVRLVASRENIGFGRGNNAGTRLATGTYCMFLNPDTVLQNNALKIFFDFMERPENKLIAACGGMLSDEKLQPTISFGRFPTTGTMIFYSIPGTKLFRSNVEGIVHTPTEAPFPVDFVSGADLFIRRNIFNQTGGFDENYFAYYEEVDLAQRIRELGYKSAIIPAARIQHLEGKSFKGASARKKLMFESSLYYLAKYEKRNRLFKFYCSVNEIKYRLYQYISTATDKTAWREMISMARDYRRMP